jgi:antitoxin component YwqK of YwqJK toxin-antitoxin module
MQVIWRLEKRCNVEYNYIYLSMKKILFLFLFITAVHSFAQTKKVFLSEDGSTVDSSKAVFYLLIKQISDTSWTANQYSMDDLIITEGTYKDESLQIPHGKFFYYNKRPKTKQQQGSVNYVQTIGEFKNGLREGQWINFNYDNSKVSLDTYLNDKLNGLHENYGDKTLPITVRGQYIENLKEGEWYIISKHGDIIRTEVFKFGKKISDNKKTLSLKAAFPPDNFNDYFIKNIGKITSNNTNEQIIVYCTITDEGKVINPKINNPMIVPELTNKLLKILSESPKWKPAYDTNLNKFIEWNVEFLVAIEKGNITTKYSSKANELLYQLNN